MLQGGVKMILGRTNDENERILEKLRDQFDSSHYDYETIFFNGSDELPR